MVNWTIELKENKYKEKILKLIPAYYEPNKEMESELINIGNPVIPSMIVALQYFQERLAWTQQKQKEDNSEITAEHLDWQEGAQEKAINSTLHVLKVISKCDFGEDHQAWQNWWEENK